MSEENKVRKAVKKEAVKREKKVEEKVEYKQTFVNKDVHPLINNFKVEYVKYGCKYTAEMFYNFAVELDKCTLNGRIKDRELRKLLEIRNKLIGNI